jgi:hypothetical protein
MLRLIEGRRRRIDRHRAPAGRTRILALQCAVGPRPGFLSDQLADPEREKDH